MFSNEAIETACLALIANHTSFKLGLAITLANLIIGSLTQGIFLSLRIDLFSVKKLSIRLLHVLMPLLAVTVYGVAISLSKVSFWSEPLLSFLVASRICASIVQLSLETQTAEYNLQQRVYLSPWVSFAGVALVAAVGALSLLAPSTFTLYALLASSSVVKISTSIFFYRQTRQAMLRRPLAAKTSGVGEFVVSQTTQRIVLMFSEIAVSIFPAFYINSKALEAFAVVVVVKNLLKMFTERPFRTVHVEVVKAAQFSQWEFVASVLRKATKTSFILMGVCAFAALAVALAATDAFVSLSIVWAGFFTLNSALILRLMTVGLDSEVSKVVIATRVITGLAPLVFDQFARPLSSEHVLASMVMAEVLIASYLLRNYVSVDMAQRLEFKVEVIRGLSNKSAQPLVRNFLNCFRVISPYLDALGVSQDLILVKVRRPIRSPEKARSFIADLSGVLRSADLLIAVNSTHFILWAPSSTTYAPIKARLFKKWPLLIDSVTTLNRASFLSLIKAKETKFFAGATDDIKRHSYSLLAALELSLKARVKTSVDGHWWAPDAAGNWQSLAEDATSAQNKKFHEITTKALKDVFLSAGRNKTFRSPDSLNWVLSPHGKVLAIYSAPKLDVTSLEALQAIHYEMIAEVVEKSDHGLSVSPAEFYMLKRILEELSKRVPIKFEVRRIVLQPKDDYGRLLASTSDGFACSHGIFLVHQKVDGKVA
jgi:hypothetical protein